MSDTPPCPKCSSATDDIGDKYVCGECYWVFDKAGPAPQKGKSKAVTPSEAPAFSKDPRAPLPTVTGAASTASTPLAPTACPKCSGTTTDIGGRFVCDNCYWVIEPNAPAAKPARDPRLPEPSAEGAEGAMSGKAVGGAALIILLVLMIVVLLLRH